MRRVGERILAGAKDGQRPVAVRGTLVGLLNLHYVDEDAGDGITLNEDELIDFLRIVVEALSDDPEIADPESADSKASL